MISRRRFFKNSALLVAGLATSERLIALGSAHAVGSHRASSISWLAQYLNALDNPQFAPLNAVLDDIVDDKGNLCVLVYDVNRAQLITGLQTEAPMPIASAFKGPLFIYFMSMIDEVVWSTVPFEYWQALYSTELPEQYRAAWLKHRQILSDLYQCVVLSSNEAAGRVFTYVARFLDTDAPLVPFNDWSHDVVGISQMSSMGSWNYGMTAGRYNTNDERYAGRTAVLNHQLIPFNNLMTCRDLGLYYAWWQNQMSVNAIRVGETVLSAINNNRRANVEQVAEAFGGEAFSKNGSLSSIETGVAAVVTDGGLVRLPDGGYYVIVYLAGIADSRTPRIFERIQAIVRGDFDIEIAGQGNVTDIDAEQRQFFTDYLTLAYPDAAAISAISYNYGFIKHEGVTVYQSADETRPVRNPVISSSRFGVHLLMQGALARYIPHNRIYDQLIPDSPRDNVQMKLAAPLYVKHDDLHPISLEYTQHIPYFYDPTVTADEKLVIIDTSRRELTLFEHDKAIFKTPVVINNIDTPVGEHLTTTHWLACSMQPWAPGVPFTTFFHVDGYAIHGAPWQRWEKTVTQENVFQRTSAGCVNIPNWIMTIGDYTRPVDELIFRWLGGVVEPESYAYEYGTKVHPAVRIYVVDNIHDLYAYSLPLVYRALQTNWESIVVEVATIASSAPSGFWL